MDCRDACGETRRETLSARHGSGAFVAVVAMDDPTVPTQRGSGPCAPTSETVRSRCAPGHVTVSRSVTDVGIAVHNDVLSSTLHQRELPGVRIACDRRLHLSAGVDGAPDTKIFRNDTRSAGRGAKLRWDGAEERGPSRSRRGTAPMTSSARS